MGEGREERIEQVLTLEVPTGYEEGVRIDRYVTRFLPNVSRTKVQRGITEGFVTVNDEVVRKASHPVQAGDVIVCKVLRPPPIEARPEAISLDIVYEDEHLIIVNKPAGMVVHPAYGNRSGTLVNALLHHVGADTIAVEVEDEDDDTEDDDTQEDDTEEDDVEIDDVGLSTLHARPDAQGDPSIRPGIVHRLDKDTSGLLVVAKTDLIHRELAKQFADHTIERRYLAVVWGLPNPSAGTIETDLGRDPRDRKKIAVLPQGKGRKAVTHFEVLEPFEHTSLVAFRLETGRTHQIRVHAASLSHPVLGDATYGGTSIRYGPVSANRRAYFRNLFVVLQRQALHAESLGFYHPGTGERVSFRVDPPADMRAAIEKLRRGGG